MWHSPEKNPCQVLICNPAASNSTFGQLELPGGRNGTGHVWCSQVPQPTWYRGPCLVWCRSGHSANIDICPRILDHKLFLNHILKTRINVKSACSIKVTNQILNRPPMFSESRVFVFLSVFSNSPYAARRDVSHCWCLYFASRFLLPCICIFISIVQLFLYRDVSHCWCLYFANGNLLLRSFLAAALVPFLLKVSTEPGNKAPLWFPSQ